MNVCSYTRDVVNEVLLSTTPLYHKDLDFNHARYKILSTSYESHLSLGYTLVNNEVGFVICEDIFSLRFVYQYLFDPSRR